MVNGKFGIKKFLAVSLIISGLQCFVPQLYAQDTVSSPTRPALTPEERDFIATHKILNVACDPNWPPFEYFDRSLKIPMLNGINIEILRTLSTKAGIELNFIPTASYEESIELMNSGKIDILTGFTSKVSDNENITLTDHIYSLELMLISSTGNMPEKGETIGMPHMTGAEYEAVLEKFPPDKYNIHIYDFPSLALEDFAEEKIKYTIIGPYELADFPSLPAYTSFPLGIEYFHQYAVAKKLGSAPVSILNKEIASLTQDEFENIIFRNQAERLYYLREKNYVNSAKRATLRNAIAIIIIILGSSAALSALMLRRKTRVIGYDELTGLPTLNNFKRSARELLKTAEPDEYIIISLDINNFKFINDSHGYAAGNLILVEQSNHLKKECKNGELLCRFFADNFIILARNPGYLALTEDFVTRLTQVEEQVIKILPEHYNLTFSSGIYYVSDPKADISGMIDKANHARNVGKKSYSTHRVYEYTKEMDRRAQLDKEITLTMEKALENNEFEVYYQPKYYLSTEKILGAEALIRWNNPEKGFMPPDAFVPLFEQNGFIQKIDVYVFEHVCKFLTDWNKSGPDGKCPLPLTISFNLSRMHLHNPDLIQMLTDIFNKYSVAPNHVEVELTESAMFDNPQHLIKVMNGIKKAGFSISVDDFGSGYSSLNMLKDIPADVLKLDKEFLSKASDEGNRDTVIISSVIDMAKKLRMTTVAEGIETKNQSDLLRDMGCDVAQGYYYAKPMREHEFLDLLKKQI